MISNLLYDQQPHIQHKDASKMLEGIICFVVFKYIFRIYLLLLLLLFNNLHKYNKVGLFVVKLVRYINLYVITIFFLHLKNLEKERTE